MAPMPVVSKAAVNNQPTGLSEVESYNPEFFVSIKIWFKTEFLDKRFRLNATYFHNDYKDIQLLVHSLDPATSSFLSILKNTAQANYTGYRI